MDAITAGVEIKRSVKTLLANVVDYAGLFPPAALSMPEAVINYATYRTSNYSWMLGRFVVTAERLDEFYEAAEDFILRDSGDAWRISVVAGEDINDTIRRVKQANQKFGDGAVIDSLEVRASSTSKVDNTMRDLPSGITVFFELGLGENFPELVAMLAERGASAKIRTGGVTPDAFPKTMDIVKFVRTCLAANVPFKATAGLHHPIRCYRPLTYEENSVQGTMHGFLNLFLMTGMAREGYRMQLLEDVMEEEFNEVFEFEDSAVTWRHDYRLTVPQLALLREKGIQSFGSCSFDEPVADLQKLGVL